MNHTELQDAYEKAYKSAKQAWNQKVLKGESGYLRDLDSMIQSGDIAAEFPLGLVDIPINKIVGTYTHARSVSFADNYMPIMNVKTEFATKWMYLYGHHIDKGITDPIKVYEYLNRFFVIEGNKRVSVLKFVEGTTISGQVIRLIPKRDTTSKSNTIYYEFINFYKETKINTIWFSEIGRFPELLIYIRQYKDLVNNDEDYNKIFLANCYRPFRQMYLEQGGEGLDITTGDAFLTFLKVYGLDKEITAEIYRNKISSLINEISVMDAEAPHVQTEKLNITRKKSMFSSISDFMASRRRLKIAFVYAKPVSTSGWAYAHELGRLHIDNIFKDQITTTKIEGVAENDKAFDTFKALASEDYDIVFTTSPTYLAPALKAAMEFPNVKFFNCAATHSYKSLTLYNGRIHEPRYLLGMIAGAMTENNVIGYVAPYPISEVVSSINAFTLGAQAVNPRIKVKALWTNRWDNPEGGKAIAEDLFKMGADIISNEDLPIPGDISKAYGIYSVNPNTHQKTHYAMAIWNWGIFYEEVIQNMLNGTWKSIQEDDKSDIPVNFWQGMSNGLVDLLYSNRNITPPMKLLIDNVKQSIMRNEFNIFKGPIYDQNHILRAKTSEILDYESIIHMDWLVEGVDGEIPNIKTLTPADPFSYMQGITGK